jgi:hypothetical protein
MYHINRSANRLFLNLIGLLIILNLLPGKMVFAEGSKELNANGGSRAFPGIGTTVTPLFFPYKRHHERYM